MVVEVAACRRESHEVASELNSKKPANARLIPLLTKVIFTEDGPVRTMGPMRDTSIAARTEELRREIALIQQAENSYGSGKNHSLAENAEHYKREFRMLVIREELRTFVEKAKEQFNDGTVWYS